MCFICSSFGHRISSFSICPWWSEIRSFKISALGPHDQKIWDDKICSQRSLQNMATGLFMEGFQLLLILSHCMSRLCTFDYFWAIFASTILSRSKVETLSSFSALCTVNINVISYAKSSCQLDAGDVLAHKYYNRDHENTGPKKGLCTNQSAG